MKQNNGQESGTSYEYAGFRRRLLAHYVDYVIVFIFTFVVAGLVGWSPLKAFETKTLAEAQLLNESMGQRLFTIVSLAISLFYAVLMWVNFDGATPGKKMLGIKIIKDDGKKLTYPVAIIRHFSTYISYFTFFLGHLWVIWDKKKQGWHDKLAGTVVIKTGARSNTALAVMLSIVSFLILSVYFSAALYHGFKLGIDDAKAKKQVTKTEQTIVQNNKEMLPGAKVHYDNAEELFKQMRAESTKPAAVKPLADKAIKELLLAADIEPSNPLIWNSLGNAYTWVNNVGTLDNSLNAYKKAEELEPTNYVYSAGVGEILLRMRRYDEAVLQLNKTLRQAPDYGYAHLSIAKAYKGLGVYQEMSKHLRSAIAIFEKENSNGGMDTYILEAQKLLNNPN